MTQDNGAPVRAYHVEGETSTFGPRWRIWGREECCAVFTGIDDEAHAQAIADTLNASASTPTHLDWLIDQLERWPTRVHPERTTNIEYLMKEAAKEIRAARGQQEEALENYRDLLCTAFGLGYPSVMDALQALRRMTDEPAPPKSLTTISEVEEWADPDDAPELSSEWFERATKHPASALEARQGRDGAAGSIGEADDIATAEGRDAQNTSPNPKQEGE